MNGSGPKAYSRSAGRRSQLRTGGDGRVRDRGRGKVSALVTHAGARPYEVLRTHEIHEDPCSRRDRFAREGAKAEGVRSGPHGRTMAERDKAGSCSPRRTPRVNRPPILL